MNFQPYHEQVKMIKELLTPETWQKGSYFKVLTDKVCYCVHGAGQFICNPKVNNILSKWLSPVAMEGAAALGATAAGHGARVVATRGRRAERLAKVVASASSGRPLRSAAGSAAGTAAAAAAAAQVQVATLAPSAVIAPTNAAAVVVARMGMVGMRQILPNSNASPSAYLEAWRRRPQWINQTDPAYGSTNLHYLLGMFGITASFNDAAETTLKMLHEKLDECAAWAEENSEFLRDN